MTNLERSSTVDDSRDHRSTRLLLGGVIPLAIIAMAYVPYALWRNDVPGRLATHFDGSGTPDDSMTVTQFLTIYSILVLASITACIGVAVRREPLPPIVGSFAGFMGGFLGGLFAAIAGTTFYTQRNLVSWQDADSPWVLVIIAMAYATALGLGAARLASKLPSTAITAPDPTDSPSMALGADEHAVWTTTLSCKWLLYFGTAAAAVGVLVAIGTFWWIAIPSAIIAVATLSLSTIDVRADRHGLRVKYGILPWPTTTIPIAKIANASVLDVRPMQWGGWGYRGSLKFFGRAALVLRAGPGIRLDLSGDKTFVVTVDNPEPGVALLNAEVGRLVNA